VVSRAGWYSAPGSPPTQWRGQVWAKTGWIDTAYTLSGFVDADDGTRLTFAFYAIGPGIQDNAKEALDTLVTGVYKCGNNLANF
jgi:D-alanyl-D-alanine carboxypeptidase/D-alanyl-D-alanine-endopeptidase (penicillin-binding protein 4)